MDEKAIRPLFTDLQHQRELSSHFCNEHSEQTLNLWRGGILFPAPSYKNLSNLALNTKRTPKWNALRRPKSPFYCCFSFQDVLVQEGSETPITARYISSIWALFLKILPYWRFCQISKIRGDFKPKLGLNWGEYTHPILRFGYN